ncbi:calmodulin-alpha-like [Actinia tenebrosa]|uniref:Calmodulin-alpha-like n=1 Tax=Actinia tenebrosa TaxID=6105 RepID=A0A6P8HFM0_ACTTE|nr:calmodulin-alpha-like [Actinia tenebrosa]
MHNQQVCSSPEHISKELEVMEYLSEEQIQEYKVVFEAIQKDDKRPKSHIKRRELGIAMRMIGLNPREDDLQEFINTIEFEDNGRVDFAQFVEMMEEQRSHSQEEEDEVRMAFNVFDSDCRGYIEANELRYVMETVQIAPEEKLNEMLQDLGIDKERKISFEEFKTFVSPKTNLK